MAETFFWYDLETTGTHSVLDRIVQFAGQRTDMSLKPVGPAINFYIKPAWEALIHPEAALVTGIDPELLDQNGVTERVGLERILEQFAEPGTCVVGYNSFRFDDEFIRQGLYRNFFDPYAREWQNGNSRWDLIQLARLAYGLRPDGLDWPTHPSGKPSFKLEDLARANQLQHTHAHDALSDIHATIGLASRLQKAQPRLFDYHYRWRRKQTVIDAMYPLGKTPWLFAGGFGPISDRTLVPLLPFMTHPVNANSLICIDLRVDPSTYLDLSPDKLIARCLGTENEPLSQRILHIMQINRCPPVAPFSTLPEAVEPNLSWQVDSIKGHVRQIQKSPRLFALLSDGLLNEPRRVVADVDFQLYSGGFVSKDDQQKFSLARQSLSPDLVFDDDRLNELYFRFRARQDGANLTEEEQIRWHAYLQALWCDNDRLRDLYQLTQKKLLDHPDSDIVPKLLDRLSRQAADLEISLI